MPKQRTHIPSTYTRACPPHTSKQDTLTSHPSRRTTAADAKPRARKKDDDEDGKDVPTKRCRGTKLLVRLLLVASKRRCPQRAS